LLRGTVTASLLVGRLHAQQRRSTLAAALQDYGRLVKTEFILGYLTQPPQRRGIHRQLNKGESINALEDAVSTATKAASASRPRPPEHPSRRARARLKRHRDLEHPTHERDHQPRTLRRPGTPTDQAWIESLFSHIKADWLVCV
jgi:hypothetical protein